MKETTDYTDNIMDIVLSCRKLNAKIGARQRHFYSDKNNIRVQLSGNAELTIPVLIAENGASQITNEALNSILSTYHFKLK